MKEIPELADKIRGAGGVKVCYGSDERVLSPMQQAWIADALVAYEKARTTRPEALPKEPTHAMLEAMVRATWDMDHSDLKWSDAMRIARKAYRAARNAASVPSPQGKQ